MLNKYPWWKNLLVGLAVLLGLVYAAVVVVFTVPKVYDMHHADIDGAINLFR